jgi:N-acetylmuramoyl-L-alanine amidase
MNGLWASTAPNALFFHARRVSPNWGKKHVATVGNHIFYR